jgi:hypothetical protein
MDKEQLGKKQDEILEKLFDLVSEYEDDENTILPCITSLGSVFVTMQLKYYLEKLVGKKVAKNELMAFVKTNSEQLIDLLIEESVEMIFENHLQDK